MNTRRTFFGGVVAVALFLSTGAYSKSVAPGGHENESVDFNKMRASLFGENEKQLGDSMCFQALFQESLIKYPGSDTTAGRADRVMVESTALFCKEMAMIYGVELVTPEANQELCQQGVIEGRLLDIRKRAESIQKENPALVAEQTQLAQRYAEFAAAVSHLACKKLKSSKQKRD